MRSILDSKLEFCVVRGIFAGLITGSHSSGARTWYNAGDVSALYAPTSLEPSSKCSNGAPSRRMITRCIHWMRGQRNSPPSLLSMQQQATNKMEPEPSLAKAMQTRTPMRSFIEFNHRNHFDLSPLGISDRYNDCKIVQNHSVNVRSYAQTVVLMPKRSSSCPQNYDRF